ncbi:MAG: ribosome maturation factor RimM [Acidobacteriota bacterium]
MSNPAPEQVLLGLVARGRGLRGEMMLDRAVEGKYPKGLGVQIGTTQYPLDFLKPHQGRSLLKVIGIETIEQAEAQRGLEVSVARADVPTAAGDYLLQDLIGCDVVDDTSGHHYGTVSDWQTNGPQTLLEVHIEAPEPMLVPLVPAICVAVLPTERTIRVKLPEGLATLNSPSARA